MQHSVTAWTAAVVWPHPAPTAAAVQQWLQRRGRCCRDTLCHTCHAAWPVECIMCHAMMHTRCESMFNRPQMVERCYISAMAHCCWAARWSLMAVPVWWDAHLSYVFWHLALVHTLTDHLIPADRVLSQVFAVVVVGPSLPRRHLLGTWFLGKAFPAVLTVHVPLTSCRDRGSTCSLTAYTAIIYDGSCQV